MALIKIPKEIGSTPGIVDNSNPTAITIDSSENVGIGITPSVKLEVNGGSDGSVVFSGRSDGGNGNNRRFNLIAYADGGGANYGGGLKIQTRSSTNVFSDAITVSSAGLVGIGSSTPANSLTICNPANTNRNGMELAVGATDTLSNTIQNYNRATSAYTPLNIASSILTFGVGTNATERMRIDSTGNLLLGTNGVIGGAGGSGAQIFVKQAASSNGISSVANSNNNYVRMLHTGTTGKVETTYGTGGSYTPLAFFTNGSEHMRLETAGNLNLLDGNLIFAAGHGVDFSANPHSGARTSELLDDYEEGTWTPTIFAVGGGTVTGITVGEAYYTKVGRNVNIYTYISSINLAQLTTGTYVCLGGLPFTCNGYSDFNFTYIVVAHQPFTGSLKQRELSSRVRIIPSVTP